MGKTFRNAPSNFDDGKKIKSIDKKHQKVKVFDGAYAEDLEDDGGVVYNTPAAKKLLKKSRTKKERKW